MVTPLVDEWLFFDLFEIIEKRFRGLQKPTGNFVPDYGDKLARLQKGRYKRIYVKPVALDNQPIPAGSPRLDALDCGCAL